MPGWGMGEGRDGLAVQSSSTIGREGTGAR